MKNTLVIIHKTSALTAFILIATFFSSSLFVDIFANQKAVVMVKTNIFYGVFLLILLMAITGITGLKMAAKVTSGPIASKKKRMPFVAANGLLVLLPAAYILKDLALEGEFNSVFYFVQTIELLAGFINLSLMTLNIRDAFRLKKTRTHIAKSA